MNVSITLRPNKGFERRAVIWNRMTADGFPCAGVITVQEQKKKGGAGKVYTRRYAVQELAPEGKDRRFQVTKPGGADRYYVCLRASLKQPDECVCKGFEGFGVCTHIESLRGLEREGHLPAPTNPQPV